MPPTQKLLPIGAAISLFFSLFFLLVTLFFMPAALAQTAPCPTTSGTAANVINGLITGGSVSSFTSDTGNCISSTTAKIATYKLPSYADLKSIFYTQLKTTSGVSAKYPSDTSQPAVTDSNFITYSANLNNIDSTILVSGDLHLTSPTQISGTHSGVIFVDGNLYIGYPSDTFTGGATNNGQLTYGSNGISGLVFVVRDNIFIDKSITRVDAVLISGGQICTAYDASNPSTICPLNSSTTSYITPMNNYPLIVNGALVSLTSNPNQDIKFSRSLFDNTQPAEQIFTQPKYLVVLKNLFSQSYIVQTEVSASTINNTSSLVCTPNCPPPSSVSCGQQIYNSCGGTTNSQGAACGTGTLCSGNNTCVNGTCTPITIGSITVTPTSVTRGTNVTVDWSIPNPTSFDTLALYSVGTSGPDWISQLSTSCAGSKSNGSCSFLIPAFAPKSTNGYVIEYISNGNYTSPVATSNVFQAN